MTTQQKFNDWLDGIVMTEKPDKDIIAYWFGIFESTSGYETYLIGSKIFDDNDPDWACNVDFVPKNKYLTLTQSGTDWQIILDEVKKYVTDYLQTSIFKNSFLDKSIAIACGFDDGDLYRLK
jgi:hypothetical protein